VQTDRELGKLGMRSIVFHHDAGIKVHVRGVRACAPMPPSQDQADAERLHHRSTPSKSTLICIASTPSTASQSAKYVYAVYSKPIYAKSSCASTPALASTHLRLLLVNRAGSSSPTSFMVIIADNHLHQQTPSRRRHHHSWSTSNADKISFSY
jgi:hypothetical protein